MLAGSSAGAGGGQSHSDDPYAFLPVVPASNVHIVNLLSQRRSWPALTWAGKQVELQIRCLDFAPESPVSTSISIGSQIAEIGFQAPFASKLANVLHYSGTLAEEAPAQRAVLVELALLEVIQQMEAALREPIRIVPTPPEPTDATPVLLDLSLRFEDEPEIRCCFRLPAGLAEQLVRALQAHIPAHPLELSFMPVAIALRAGSQTLSLAQIRSLAAGDVVMLDELFEQAVFENGLAVSVKPVENGFRMETPLTRFRTEMESARMADMSEQSILDELPMKLVFEFGRIEMELGDVRALNSGSILPFSRPLDEAVDIVVNGRRIGRGNLVKIGDGFGVRVSRLTTDE